MHETHQLSKIPIAAEGDKVLEALKKGLATDLRVRVLYNVKVCG
jgi:hypothetical protein